MSDKVDHFFDQYSVAHAAVGVLFAISHVPPSWALGSHLAFELSENTIKRSFGELWPDARPDAWQNHTGDVASFAAGYYAARAWRDTPAGRVALAALVATGGAVWVLSLTGGKLWRQPGRAARQDSFRR